MAGTSDRLKGMVTWYHVKRGFGFIAPKGSEEDLYVHKSSIKAVGIKSLTVSEAVEFGVSVGDDGRARAVNVTGPGGAYIIGGTDFRGASYRGSLACYSCGDYGHFAGDCPVGRFGRKTIFDDLSDSINSEEEQAESPGVEERNWAELPCDALSAWTSDRLKGMVTWYHVKRGFGFIAPKGSEEDLFVHKSSIKAVGIKSLTVGEAVEFGVSVGDDGRARAVNVTGPGGAYIIGGTDFRGASYRGSLACYSCGDYGHFAGDCPVGRFGRKTIFDDPSDSINSEEEQAESPGVEERNWAELPCDVLLVIFKKIAAIEILTSAQFVCRAWRQLSYDLGLWRCIDMTKQADKFGMTDLEYIAKLAVDRSEGCVEKFYAQYCASYELLGYIADRATQLRRFRLISVDGIPCMTLVQALRRFPLLEEFEISFCSFPDKVVELIGRACPELKSFGLNSQPYRLQYDSDSHSDGNIDTVALSVAKHMKQLCRLQLYGNSITNIGLFDILNNCPYLECLDIRGCYNVVVDENLKKKCARIKDLRLPNYSITGYEFDAITDRHETDDETEYDFQYDDYTYHDYDGFCGLRSEYSF